MRLYNFAGWLLLTAFLFGLHELKYEPPELELALSAAVDTVTYGDDRIVYKVSTDTARNSNGDLRRLPDLSNAPTGARFRIIWDTSASWDSALIVTGDTFAMSPLDSTTAATVASNWGYSDPYEIALAWHDTTTTPPPLEGAALVAVYDTLRFSWDATSDSVRVFTGLDGGGDEDTVYVAGNASPSDRVAPTIPGNYYACGNTYTDQATANYSDNRCDNVTVDTASPGGGGDYPNEPAGLTTVVSVDFTDSINAQTGVCTESSDSFKQANSEYIEDLTSPSGTDTVFRGKFPDGMNDGISPWRFDCWGPSIDISGQSNQYDEVYTSTWVKIEGSDYEQQSVDTKGYLIGYGTPERHNDGSVNWGPCTFGEQSICSSVYHHAKLSENDPDDTSAITIQPLTFDRLFTIGSWHQVEVYWKINDIGSANGIIRVWVDGTLHIENTSWQYRSSTNPNAFYHIQWTPVWGGNAGDVRTRDDFWRIDEFYVSGAN